MLSLTTLAPKTCKSLRALGYHVILFVPIPLQVYDGSEMADVTYIEPLTVGIAEQIIQRERPDAILPTVGGQTTLNWRWISIIKES